MFLQLKKNWHGNFRRSYGPSDNRTILEWSPGDVLEVTDESGIGATKDDIGKALIAVRGPVTEAMPVETEDEVIEEPPHEPRGKGKLRGKDAG